MTDATFLTPEQLRSIVDKCESEPYLKQNKTPQNLNQQISDVPNRNNDYANERSNSDGNSDRVCTYCHKGNHNKGNCIYFKANVNPQDIPKTKVCFNCKKTGHYSYQCKANKVQTPTVRAQAVRTREDGVKVANNP